MRRHTIIFYLIITTVLTSLATQSHEFNAKILDANYKTAHDKYGHVKPADHMLEHHALPDDFHSAIHRQERQNYDFKYHGICYKILSDNEVSVTYDENLDFDENGSSYSGDIIIPSTVTNGESTYSVTEIGQYAFGACNNLLSVQMPNTITVIQPMAFIGSSIATIDIPNSVQIIGEHAFYACKSLQDVTLPEGLTIISDYLFCYCSSLKNLYLPSTLQSIRTSPFYECYSLENIYIPSIESWLQISSLDYDNNPISYARHLIADGKEVVDLIIPESITEINPFAFYGYSNLRI